MATDRNEAPMLASNQTAGEADVYERLDGVDAVRVLRQPHRPHEDRLGAIDQQTREVDDPVAGHAAAGFDLSPVDRVDVRARRIEAHRPFPDELLVHAAELNERLQHTVQEGEIAAGVDVEPVIGESGSVKRAG